MEAPGQLPSLPSPKSGAAVTTSSKSLMYSGTSPYVHFTSKKTSQLQSPWLSPKLYSTVQITPCNKVTSPLRSLLPSPVSDLNSDVPLYTKNK